MDSSPSGEQWHLTRISTGTGEFNLFINDLDLGVSSVVANYAVDTKLFSKFTRWITMWQMKFIASKCNVMLIGTKKIPNFNYTLIGSKLNKTERGKTCGCSK